jgi:hypothetical protein
MTSSRFFAILLQGRQSEQKATMKYSAKIEVPEPVSD